MNKPVLVVMAAGMGSRYGGMKQIDPVGPNGQVIVDYSLYDARRAGFETVIFVIKHEIEDAFFPQPEWIVDAKHQRILPLPGHICTHNCTELEQIRENRLGI